MPDPSDYSDFYQQSVKDPIGFWKDQARLINWFKFPKEILSKDEHDLYRWYKGGKLNSSFLALDQHVNNGRGNQTALIYDSPVTQTKKQFTYSQLLREVELVAGMLVGLGVKKGDRVIIYMPMIPETTFAMLACARVGAVHSVVFGGFAPHELALRIDDSKPKVILTASAGLEIDKVVHYKPMVDAGIAESKYDVPHVVVYQRAFAKAELDQSRDKDWHSRLAKASPQTWIELDAHDPLYIIYTSGTTGKPKGVVRDNGGHAVAMKFSMKYVYGADQDDVYWAGSDYGWAVGHSYIVYGPLIHGCTTVLYEGKPIRTPAAGAFWRVIEEYKVNIFFTAPTAFRAIKKEDPSGKMSTQYDLSSLKRQFLAGERCDISTLNWLADLIGVPVIDHWWQTESGWPMISQMAGIEMYPIKPGSSGKAVPGYEFTIVDDDGDPQQANKEGALMIRYPLPPGTLPNLWQDTQRFKNSYLSKVPDFYFSGDGAYIDEEGYIFITGRIDDVINVAGHRLSTAEMEEIIASNLHVAECAVIGVNDDYKGQVPIGLVVLKSGSTISQDELEKELVDKVREQIGPVASFKKALIVKRLPKTRSGKILRKTLRSIADGETYSTPSTIEDISVLDEIEVAFKD